MKTEADVKRFVRFVMVGVMNTLNYYIVYLLLTKMFGVPYIISHVTGFIVAMIISFYLNCYFVYHVRPTIRKFLQFPLTQVVNISVQTLLLYILVDKFRVNDIYAPFPALIITIPITYLVTTYILKEKGEKNEETTKN